MLQWLGISGVHGFAGPKIFYANESRGEAKRSPFGSFGPMPLFFKTKHPLILEDEKRFASIRVPIGFFKLCELLKKSFFQFLFLTVFFVEENRFTSLEGDLFGYFWSRGSGDSFLDNCGKYLRFFPAP